MTPFMQSSIAQQIIQNKLVERSAPSTVNSAGMFRNPIYDLRTVQERAGELDPSAQFPNPIINNLTPPTQDTVDETIPNCDELYPGEGRVYDPILKACVLPATDEADDNDTDTPDRNQLLFNQMVKDPSTPFGASNILDDYVTQGMGEGTFLKFDPSVGRLGSGSINPFLLGGGMIVDALFGMPQRRQNTFNTATQTLSDLGYGQSAGNNLFQVFSPNQYYKSVASNMINPQGMPGSNVTVAEAVDSVMNPQPQSGESSGSPIAQDLGGSLLFTDRLTTQDSGGNITGRDDNAYRAEVARNIERNKRNFGTSKFTPGIGFTGGR